MGIRVQYRALRRVSYLHRQRVRGQKSRRTAGRVFRLYDAFHERVCARTHQVPGRFPRLLSRGI